MGRRWQEEGECLRAAAAAPRPAIDAHFVSVYVVVSVLAGSSVRGGAGTHSGASTSSPLCFLCCYLFRGGVPGSRLPVAELRSVVNVILLRPLTFCAWFRSCLYSVVALNPPPPPRFGSCQRLAVKLEEGERRVEGEGILAFI